MMRAVQRTRNRVPSNPGLKSELVSTTGPARRLSRVAATGVLDCGDAAVLAFALDNTGMAVFVLDGSGRLRFANDAASAILVARDAMYLDPAGFLRSTGEGGSAVKNWQRCRSRKKRRDGPRPELETITIPKREGWPLAGFLWRSAAEPDDDAARGDAHSRIVLFVRDPERTLVDVSHPISTLFGLSRAEANVVARLVKGDDLKDVAKRRGVSLATVRNQVKSAQSKLGVSRTTELVSVILRAVYL